VWSSLDEELGDGVIQAVAVNSKPAVQVGLFGGPRPARPGRTRPVAGKGGGGQDKEGRTTPRACGWGMAGGPGRAVGIG